VVPADDGGLVLAGEFGRAAGAVGRLSRSGEVRGENDSLARERDLRASPRGAVMFALITVLMAVSASRLRVDAGFAKLLPLKHEYMRTYLKHRDEFGAPPRAHRPQGARRGTSSRPSSSERCAP